MKILAVHQGYELYGSDRMFILSLTALKEKYPDALITANIPKDGKLADYLRDNNVCDHLVIKPMAVLRKSDIKRLRLNKLLGSLWRIRETIRFCNTYDIVYINSIVVLSYLLAARYTKGKVLLHIHEIPSTKLMLFFRQLIRISKVSCLYISQAVCSHFNLKNNGIIVINGIKGFPFQKKEFTKPLNFLMIGRINDWKGQDFLIQSLTRLALTNKSIDFRLRILGSVFENQRHFLEKINGLIENSIIKEKVKIIDFVDDPWENYRWADVVFVPSKRPEPFGLVAIEAMSAGAIVIGAEHGGLSEIFENNHSGLYFKPSDETDLIRAVLVLQNNRESCFKIAKNGRKLFEREYTEQAYINRFVGALTKLNF
ncbi:glycosyltransferase family 4 protein [Carboxylicivirga caseinilyticus]|uniref:glycosyltransferase family 4 protein n=1 Tax=Carboxylicivirga caseinilyticus TaxID=3417572 RepID=UPI003D336D02|nr:glycosyltransferase family 4 protein [Marinilabiliaceae bacterium A049]